MPSAWPPDNPGETLMAVPDRGLNVPPRTIMF
jgi:hypothetical protein